MDDLIKKLEAATGPSRVLDVEIYRATIDEFAVPFKGQFIPGMVWRAFDQGYRVKHYTGSIDDALTLVPKDWFVCIFSEDSDHNWFCALHTNRHAKQVHSDFPFQKQRATAPLAVCLAALRARIRA